MRAVSATEPAVEDAGDPEPVKQKKEKAIAGTRNNPPALFANRDPIQASSPSPVATQDAAKPESVNTPFPHLRALTDSNLSLCGYLQKNPLIDRKRAVAAD
jgi:hypothetical protein